MRGNDQPRGQNLQADGAPSGEGRSQAWAPMAPNPVFFPSPALASPRAAPAALSQVQPVLGRASRRGWIPASSSWSTSSEGSQPASAQPAPTHTHTHTHTCAKTYAHTQRNTRYTHDTCAQKDTHIDIDTYIHTKHYTLKHTHSETHTYIHTLRHVNICIHT